ncbi:MULTISPECIES: hypothetical protein [unclassified Streptomyces]|uniref:hypothetical protein n=1 Tax=unclassified Streptomyces TaxID=2593676 RepID=UPI0016607DD1|nr:MULTISPECIES: hypothetical protein [unclassified Streptomyces]MBD0708547.1 hypothetical protein [Streptomyces sp. CBMA291]MBD0712852.1 hypothetical protein [Streptomyces sp. CBMA370]
MNVAPHLLTEDRAEYMRLLDGALDTARARPEIDGAGPRLTRVQLRALTLNATALVTSAAANEYEHFVRLRAEHRAVLGSRPSVPADRSERGAGVLAVLGVLVPILAGTAAVVFLLAGSILHALAPAVVFGSTLLTAGLVFGIVAAAGLLCAATGLLVTALRNRPVEPGGTPDDELSRAREAWRLALLERGIQPFLHELLAATAASDTPDA